MAYNNFIPILCDHLKRFDQPRILEIGIEHGRITMPIIKNLSQNNKNFYYYGIDIEIKPIIQSFFQSIPQENYSWVEENSLIELPKLVASEQKFDLVLLDGDHNYFTVSQELELIENLLHKDSVLIIDDYFGPWALNDYWYCNYYQNNPRSTPINRSNKAGVEPAVNDWLMKHDNLESCIITPGNKLMVLTEISKEKRAKRCHALMVREKQCL